MDPFAWFSDGPHHSQSMNIPLGVLVDSHFGENASFLSFFIRCAFEVFNMTMRNYLNSRCVGCVVIGGGGGGCARGAVGGRGAKKKGRTLSSSINIISSEEHPARPENCNYFLRAPVISV